MIVVAVVWRNVFPWVLGLFFGMRRGLGIGGVAAFCAAALILGILIGFHSRPAPGGEAITLTTTVTELAPQTIRETISYTVTRTSTVAAATTLTVTLTATESITEVVTVSGGGVRVLGLCFSRTADCSSMIRYWISRANESVHVMVFGFTLDDLSEALIEAGERGVEVRVVIERESAYWSGSEYERLLRGGVEVRLDGNPHTMHHKVVVIDGKIVITGSYNWTWSAENKNDENVVVLMDEGLAESYEKEFQRVWLEAS